MMEGAVRVAGVAGAPVFAGRMRAWRVHAYGPVREARVEEARVPPLRAPSQLLVRVAAASLNPIDVAMIGGYGATLLNALRAARGAPGPELPLVPGRDFCGVVERAGAGVGARLRRGQRVWGVVPPHLPGALADYVVVDEAWAGAAPASLTDAEAGGALYAALSACAALRAAGLPAGAVSERRPRVLLLGLGGVGQAALQLLVQQRAEVLVGCSGDACAAARALGAVAALDRRAADYDAQLCDAGPYEAVVDCAGLGGWEAGARRWRYKRYVTLTSPLLREADVRGLVPGAAAAAAQLLAQCASAGGLPRVRVRWAYFAPRRADIELLRRLAERGEFRVAVQQVFPWWECARALERADAGGARGKLVVDWSRATPRAP